jgi:predicted nucleotidyltransferase
VYDVNLCGGYRRGEKEFKDIDILITRNDDGPTRHLLLKLIESLEE